MNQYRNFGFLLKDVSRLSGLNFEREAAGLNLTLAQCKVLIYLQRHEGASQARLAYLTDTDPMTLVRILDRMEKDGWIERRPDPADRRARRLYVKDAAAPVVAEIWRVADRARGAALAGLSTAEREQLVALLTRVHGNLAALVGAAAESAVGQPQSSANAATRKTRAPGKKSSR